MDEMAIARAIWLEETSEGWTDNPNERMSNASGLLVSPDHFLGAARAVIVAIANAGFIIAPQDPTKEQIAAASEATPGDVADMYRAMVGQYAPEITF